MTARKPPLTRSEQMSRIRGRDTRPEQLLRSALWAAGLRYRLQVQTPGGRADLAFPGARVVVLVDGCFWHGCPRHYVRPRSREEFWAGKLAQNVGRDRRQTLELEAQGWRVVRLWEHQIFEDLEAAVQRVRDAVACAGELTPDDWRVVRVEALDADGRTERRHLERLRDPDQRRFEDGPRVTAKWSRPTARPPAPEPPPSGAA